MAGLFVAYSQCERFTAQDHSMFLKNGLKNIKLDEVQADSNYADSSVFVLHVSQSGSVLDESIANDLKLNLVCCIDGAPKLNSIGTSLIRGYSALADNSSLAMQFLHLYHSLGIGAVKHLSGSYNIIIWDKNTRSLIAINDRFGFYPLYYFTDDKTAIISSKIDCIIQSPSLVPPQTDWTSVLEHLLFNYIVTDNTYIKGIQTLPAASVLKFSTTDKSLSAYWGIEEFLGQPQIDTRSETVFLADAFDMAVKNCTPDNNSSILLSLTGGWDSRLVLAYLLSSADPDRIKTYSFGSLNAPDIKIPQQISKDMGLIYTPIILDDDYLSDLFIKSANETIMLSGGTRNYKRSHYLYAIRKVSKLSKHLVTGIFGDQVLKVGKPSGGAVISDTTIRFLSTSYQIDAIRRFLAENKSCHMINLEAIEKDIREIFIERMRSFKAQLGSSANPAELYFSFRWMINLRKYFGNEANSYLDFVQCSSPFIDDEFVKLYSKTSYAGFRHKFEKASLKQKKQSIDLYYGLMKAKSEQLLNFSSSRGFSIKDAKSIIGIAKILKKKYLHRDSNSDDFNTNRTTEIFRDYCNAPAKNPGASLHTYIEMLEPSNADWVSLIYWLHEMECLH